MTQDEFFAQLSAALFSYAGQPEYSELMDDLKTHFAEALRHGESEAAVTARLGDPAEIAAGFRELMAGEVTPDATSGVTPAPASPASGDEDEFPALPPLPPTLGPDAGRPVLAVDLRSANLVVWGGPGGQPPRVNVRDARGWTARDSEIRVEDLDGSVRITQDPPTGVLGRLFNLVANVTVEVTLPVGSDGYADIRLATGNVELHGLELTGPAIVDTKVGNVKVDRCAARQWWVNGRVGNVRLEDSRGPVEAYSRTGNVVVANHTGAVSADLRSGNLTVETRRSDAPSRLVVRSGNVKASVGRLGADLWLDVRSGNVTVEVAELGANVTTHSRSGNVKAALGASTVALFRLSGSVVKNAFPTTPAPDGAPIVDLSTRSGTVKVTRLA
ncbi:MAG: DUF4097 family beta strand repeat-containing protein [Propionibacteriaceae bacterium]|jgi:hypothetical protein|nr:DUF4097 family beta strand repeat-containing protein [Propionibacteriaceae bacterium]